MDESQKTGRVTIAGGRLTFEDSPAAFVQDLARPVTLAAQTLRFVGGFASGDGRLEDLRRIEAEARIVDGFLRRAGRDGTATRLRLSLRPLQTTVEETRLLLMIGWREETGDMPAFAEAFVPAAVFESLKADLLAGLAGELTLRASTSLWIREEDRERAAGRPVDRYLGPDGEGSGSLPARGFVEALEWRQPEVSRPAAPPPAETGPASMPEAVAPVAEDTENETAEELSSINWSLRLLVMLCVCLLIILALK